MATTSKKKTKVPRKDLVRLIAALIVEADKANRTIAKLRGVKAPARWLKTARRAAL